MYILKCFNTVIILVFSIDCYILIVTNCYKNMGVRKGMMMKIKMEEI